MPSEIYEKYLDLCLKKIYPRLNDKQLQAVTSVKGPLLVLAGAGSGKTTVLVNRIFNIINFGDLFTSVPEDEEECAERILHMRASLNGTTSELIACLSSFNAHPCPPDRVLCITFTNKAADEFKNRLSAMLGDAAKDIWAGTFHSVCVRILRRYIDKIGYSNSFTIYDTDDAKKLVTQVMKNLKIDEKVLPVKTVMRAISLCKEERILPNEALINARDNRARSIAEIYEEYQKQLKDASALDFDDIILDTLILFEEQPDILEYYRRKFDYILVDEYQDTNPSQNMLVHLLGETKRNVCVVGDDDQSIYSFRGATVENILNFDKTFPEAKTIKLEQNYRSTKNILNAANAIIEHNVDRKGKSLWTSDGEGDKIRVRCLYTQNEEADFIANEIMRLHAFGTPLKDIAVLFRVNAVAASLEASFVKNRLPYKIFGGIRYFERKEIKDIVAYLSVISNNADNVRLKRIINVPKRSIGDTTVDTVEMIAEKENLSMFEVIRRARQFSELARSASKLEAFYNLISELTDYSATHSISELISEVIERTEYDKMLIEEDEKEKVDLVREFASSGVRYAESVEEATLAGFLEDIALVSDTDNYDSSAETVSLMTVHSAKGLEFPVVFIVAFEEGVFPSMHAIEEGKTEEERRLAYVAVTRAKERLYITYTISRLLYGFTSAARPSSFYEEIPKDLIDEPEKKISGGAYSYGERSKSGSAVSYTGKPKPKTDISFGYKSEQKPEKCVETYTKGERVIHKFFGKGTVLSYERIGTDAFIEVEFDTGVTKKLMASFAKLTKE